MHEVLVEARPGPIDKLVRALRWSGEIPMMSAKEGRRFEARAAVLRALAHPVRLYLVEKLGDGSERRVQDLSDLVDLNLSTVSRHLAQLRSAGVLTSERRGNEVFYRLRCLCLDGLFRCIENVLADKAEEHREALKE